MKNLLNLWNLVILSGLLVCSSCSNNEDKNAPIVVPDAKELNQELAANQTEGSVHLVAEADWTSSIDVSTRAGESWVSISPDHGTAGTYDITIKLQPNVTGKERKAVITIVCGDYRITIVVVQTSEDDPGIVTPPGNVKYLLSKVTRMENETEVDEEYLFNYDKQNRPVEIICQWPEDNEEWQKDSWSYTYQDGKVIEVYRGIDTKGGDLEVIEYRYTLDDQGRIRTWDYEENSREEKHSGKGVFTYGSNGEILRDEYADTNSDITNYSYAEWKDGNKVKLAFTDTYNMESQREYYDLLTYTSYANNPELNVDLCLFFHTSEAGDLCFADLGRLKLFGNYLGMRSKNYVKSYEEHYAFNNGVVDLTTLDYEFDPQTGLPVKVTALKRWNVNGTGDSDTDYYILEYKPVR